MQSIVRMQACAGWDKARQCRLLALSPIIPLTSIHPLHCSVLRFEEGPHAHVVKNVLIDQAAIERTVRLHTGIGSSHVDRHAGAACIAPFRKCYPTAIQACRLLK